MANKKCTEKDLEIIKETKTVNFDDYILYSNRFMIPTYNYTKSFEFPKKSVIEKRLQKNFIARKYAVNVTLTMADDDYWKNPKDIPDDYFITAYKYFIDATIMNLYEELGQDSKLIEFVKNKYILPDTLILGAISAQKVFSYKYPKIKRSNKTEMFNILPKSLEYNNNKLKIGTVGDIELHNLDMNKVSTSDIVRFRYNYKTDRYFIDFGYYKTLNSKLALESLDIDSYVYEEELSEYNDD